MNRYSPLNPSAFYMMQRRQRLIRQVLARECGDRIQSIRLLEIGCGNGQWLTEFQMFGIPVTNLAGIELDPARTELARARVPSAEVKQGDAAQLPWEDQSFDIVFQSTVFTSILDPDTRENAAAEMRRVCREDGFILWYDFKYNSPSNKNVQGIGKAEVSRLFAPWECQFQSVTLAPPISRRVVPVSWTLAEIIESCCPFLRTHLMATIHRKSGH